MRDYKLYLICNSKECEVFIAKSEAEASTVARKIGFIRSYNRGMELLTEPRRGIPEVLFRFASHVNQGRITLPRTDGASLHAYSWGNGDGFDNIGITYDHHKSLCHHKTVPVLKDDTEVLAKLNELWVLKREVAQLQEMKGKLLDIVAPELKEAA